MQCLGFYSSANWDARDMSPEQGHAWELADSWFVAGMRTKWQLIWWKQWQSESKDEGHHGDWLMKDEAGAQKGVLYVAYVRSILDGSDVWIHTVAEVQENIN